jgi:hypothetical protein
MRGVIGLRQSVLVLLLVAGLVVAIERLIVTDEEAVEDALLGAVDAVGAGDFDALLEAIHPGYEAGGRDREELVAYVRSLWRLYAPRDLSADVEQVTFEDDDTATARMRVRAWSAGRPWLVVLDVDLLSDDDAWRIRSVRPQRFGP